MAARGDKNRRLASAVVGEDRHDHGDVGQMRAAVDRAR